MGFRLPRRAGIPLTLSVLAVLALVSLSIGSYRSVSLWQVLEVMAGRGDPLTRAIVALRLRRTLAGIVVGASLAYAGAGLQYVFRNPLADPYIFGVASGAGLGVVAAVSIGARGPLSLYAAALAGALLALVAVSVGGVIGGGTAFSYIVAGVSVGYIAWAASTILIVALGPQAHYSLAWLFGTLAYIGGRELKVSSIVLAGVVAASLALGRRYSKLILGSDVAAIYGTPYSRALLELLLLSGLATAAATALSGPLGFVGLVAPWISRMLAGSKYTLLISYSLAWGSSLVLASDVVARLVSGMAELPLTAVMAFVGVPMIVYIMSKSRGLVP